MTKTTTNTRMDSYTTEQVGRGDCPPLELLLSPEVAAELLEVTKRLDALDVRRAARVLELEREVLAYLKERPASTWSAFVAWAIRKQQERIDRLAGKVRRLTAKAAPPVRAAA